MQKIKERKRAIHLRKLGKTYSEILRKIPVAKSTLTLWLHDVGLAKKQKQRISDLRLQAQKRGAQKRKNLRIESSRQIFSEAAIKIGKINDRELLIIGTILYWAEGSKQKEWNVSQSLQFTNSDPFMVQLYMNWLRRSLSIPDRDIIPSLAIHENNKHRIKEVIRKWKEVTGLSMNVSDRVYFKRHYRKEYRRNLGAEYYGTIRITVRRSTNLNRKVTGWIRGICENCGFV